MDPDTEVVFTYPDLFRVYKDGRIERSPHTTAVAPPSFDSSTGVTSRDVVIHSESGVSARIHLPSITDRNKKIPILIYFHGGAFCVYSASSPQYHSFANSLASKAQLLVVSVSYRLATEHLLPAAYEDSWAALTWALEPESDEWLAIHGDLDRVFIAGDSAGGNITHQMGLRAGEDKVKIEGMALIHPFFWGEKALCSETTDSSQRGFIEELWRVVNLLDARDDIDHPWINPIAEGAPSLAGVGCRRVVVCIAEKDTLVERGRAYCEALTASGWEGEAELVVSKGEPHDFHLHEPDCEEAVKLMAKLVSFFNNTNKVESEAAPSSMVDLNKLNFGSKSGCNLSSEVHINIGATNQHSVCKYVLQAPKGCDLGMLKEMREQIRGVGTRKIISSVCGLLLGLIFCLLLIQVKLV